MSSWQFCRERVDDRMEGRGKTGILGKKELRAGCNGVGTLEKSYQED